MLWRYWLYWACLGDVFGSKVKLFLHLVSKKCFDCKGQKSNSLFLKMQVLPVRGTSDLEPFFLVAKWELLLSTGKRNSSWKKNHEEVLRAFEFLFPFTLCLFLCFILWKYFYHTSPSLFSTFTTPLPSSSLLSNIVHLGKMLLWNPDLKVTLSQVTSFCLVQCSLSFWSRKVWIRLIVTTEA